MPVQTRSRKAAIHRVRTEKNTNKSKIRTNPVRNPTEDTSSCELSPSASNAWIFPGSATVRKGKKTACDVSLSASSEAILLSSVTVRKRNKKRCDLSPSASNETILPSSVTVRKINKTRLVAVSMAACTLLPYQCSNNNLTVKDMSLCSTHGAQDTNKIRNSTFLGGFEGDNIDRNFIPCEISSIKDSGEYDDTVVSYAVDEKTADTHDQRTFAKDTAPNSVKKVWFKELEKTPKDRSSGRKRKISTINERPKRTRKSQNTRSERMTHDTEILLEFEPVPLQCSDNISEIAKDITPESCPSIRGPTSSAKRRMLTYLPNEDETPACILALVEPARKSNNRESNWVWRDPCPFSIEEIDSFPDDILI